MAGLGPRFNQVSPPYAAQLDYTVTILPAIHARWLSELVGPLTAEGRATCGTCTIVSAPDVGFNATTNCCTFMPELANPVA